MADEPELIRADWPVSPRVRAFCTTRRGGVSRPPHDTFNLGAHTGDDPDDVAENRRRLAEAAELPGEPRWLRQVHGVEVAAAHEIAGPVAADAAWTGRSGVVCAVLTADCLPVLLAAQDGSVVAAVHAGWRGLVGGVVEATVAALASRARGPLSAWLGPAIGPDAFQVGAEVREAFLERDSGAGACFLPDTGGRYRADLFALTRRRLYACGVVSVRGGGVCTWSSPERFFSYRRDGETGRMATLIWLV